MHMENLVCLSPRNTDLQGKRSDAPQRRVFCRKARNSVKQRSIVGQKSLDEMFCSSHEEACRAVDPELEAGDFTTGDLESMMTSCSFLFFKLTEEEMVCHPCFCSRFASGASSRYSPDK
jgi:hypothetical protein